jgi:hypothetical protein
MIANKSFLFTFYLTSLVTGYLTVTVTNPVVATGPVGSATLAGPSTTVTDTVPTVATEPSGAGALGPPSKKAAPIKATATITITSNKVVLFSKAFMAFSLGNNIPFTII